MTTKTKGRMAALAILIIAIGITIWAVRSAPQIDPAANGGTELTTDFAAPPAPKIVDTPLGSSGSSGPVQDIVSMADEAVFTRVNRETGELEYRMTWESLDPQEGGVFHLTKPRAWIYETGRTIEVAADTGRLRWPSREREPESGLLEGDVRITARERSAAPGLADADGQEILRVLTPSLNFHSALGELRTADEVVIVSGEGARLTGQGLTIRFSQERARPLTYLRIDKGGRFTQAEKPRVNRDAPPRRAGSQPDTAAPRPDSARQPQASHAFAYYRAECLGGVKVTTDAQTVESDQATVWARLVDGRLQPGAVSTWRRASDPGEQDTPTRGAASQGGSGGAFTLEWQGPLEARAVLDEPSELAHDDVFLRLTSPQGSGVHLADIKSGGRVSCISLDYGATGRTVAMFGAGPIGVTLSAPDLVEVASGRFQFDFTTGIGAFPGPGIARAIGAAADIDDPAFERGQRPREIRWQERVDFRCDASEGPVGSQGFVLPQEAILRGAVEARDGAAAVRGDSVRAQFSQSSPSVGAAPDVELTRLSVEGSASAEDGAGARILADAMDVSFATDTSTGHSAPTFAGARGNVRAERPGESLRAGMVEARITADEKGRREVTSLDARLGVETRIVRTDPEDASVTTIEARAERMDADRAAGLISLQGSPASLSRSIGDESATISGGSLQLVDTANKRGLTVFGPGSATYTFPQDDAGAGRAHVDWQASFAYDDISGRAEASGGVVGTAEMGDAERHTLKGERLTLSLIGDVAARELGTVLVESDGNTENPAEVELRRYAAHAAGEAVKLESMAFLRGPAIELNAHDGKLSTPGAGLLLIEDRRAGKERPAGAAGGTIRGTTIFEWKGRMWLDRRAGDGEMQRGVRVRHRHAGSEVLTELECEQLRIHLEDAPGGSEGDAMSLRSAEAIGAVFARHDTLQLMADRMEYDAARGVIIAVASPGNRVTIYDEAKGRHFVAEAAEVDLASGSWKATRVSGQMLGR